MTVHWAEAWFAPEEQNHSHHRDDCLEMFHSLLFSVEFRAKTPIILLPHIAGARNVIRCNQTDEQAESTSHRT